MAAKTRKTIEFKDLQGFKKFKDFLPLLADPRDVGCEGDSPGNRELFFDQYVTLVLFELINLLVDPCAGCNRRWGWRR